ncbi:MAG: response regulator [Defluviitaleaceae bacterium]|nr:response regulator [Defluviitaleaceae bacterium]
MYNLALVDDELNILEMLKNAFPWEEMGFNIVSCCSSANDMLDYLRDNNVDVMITDIVLGGETGLDLSAAAQKIRPNMIIVIVSAHNEFEYARTAMRLSIFDYLLKPVTYEGVKACFSAVKDKLDILKKLNLATDSEKNNASNYRVNMIKSYIDKHYGEDISLDSMAALVAMNPAYFSRFFKRHAGMQFSDYLVKRRMEKAIELLRDPRHKIFEISSMVGYYGKQSFYNQFRKYTGCTPLEYRDKVLKMTDVSENK